MLRFSKKAMVAIEAVLDIAYYAGGRPVQSRKISGRLGMPYRYLEPVLQQLVHDGILDGVRGPSGGYRLAREPGEISLAQIARAACSKEARDDPFNIPAGSPLGQKIVRPLWFDLAMTLTRELENITIEDLCRQAKNSGIGNTIADAPAWKPG